MLRRSLNYNRNTDHFQADFPHIELGFFVIQLNWAISVDLCVGTFWLTLFLCNLSVQLSMISDRIHHQLGSDMVDYLMFQMKLENIVNVQILEHNFMMMIQIVTKSLTTY